MSTKPILFNTDMVRALQNGTKTVTRRVVKPQPEAKLAYCCMGHGHGKWSYPGKDAYKYWEDESFKLPEDISPDELKKLWTPTCHTGDILYVRETWYDIWDKDGMWLGYGYAADGEPNTDYWGIFKGGYPIKSYKWHPSIHMPREAARIFLRVTDVRVERLLTPFFADGPVALVLRQEGMTLPAECMECIENYGNPACVDASDDSECGILDEIRGDFSDLWDKPIKPKDRALYGWEANPWVWVIEFEQISKEEAQP